VRARALIIIINNTELLLFCVLSTRWRPKRASDRLLQSEQTSNRLSPPQKKKSDVRGLSQSTKCISVQSLDSLAELRGDEHAGSLSSLTMDGRTPKRCESGRDAAEGKGNRGNTPDSLTPHKNSSLSSSDQTSEDDFTPLSRTRNKPSAEEYLPKDVRRPSVSSETLSPKTTPKRRRSLDRMLWLTANDQREKERQKWREFREKKMSNRSAVLQLQLRKPKQTPTEPIVLSSEEEDEDDGDGPKTSQSSSRVEDSHQGNSGQIQLKFSSLHAGLNHADANGEILVRTASDFLYYLQCDAQANLLQTELSAIQTCDTASGPPCSFLLLVLKEQLQELQAALLASILDMEELIQYPAPPCKGRITVTKEDLACLNSGEFLNDVIIDFYLNDRHMRHQRVKTWTRHVDIFTKDFLFVPVNQEPCILVMDSLKVSYHENVCRLLRDYLQVEWEVRRATPRLFTSDNMRSSNCRVPQQDNSSDCGLYLLQYVESFLQNPVVHFDLPLRLDHWFPRQLVRQKREEIRSLIMRMHQSQSEAT
ncbi:Sentrin-specific protease 7, partial [Nibea albiflora]